MIFGLYSINLSLIINRLTINNLVGQRTIRGCKSELEAQLTSQCTTESCGLCDSDLCNSRIYPEDRQQCHKCTTCDYIENNSVLGICENYQEIDSCYVVVDQVANPETSTIDIVSYRGCTSTEDEGNAYCLSHPEKCVYCTGPGCNNQPSYTDSKLTCYKCDGSLDNNCPFSQDGQESKLCDYNTFLGAREQCYTYTKPNGMIVRGCLKELTANDEIRLKCESNDETCKVCAGEDCNKDTTVEDYGTCVLCDGETDPNCATLEASYATMACPKSDVKGCFRADICKVLLN